MAAPKAPGLLAAPKAGVLAAPKPAPNAGCVEPKPVLDAPNVGVAGCPPKAGVLAAPKRGFTTHVTQHN